MAQANTREIGIIMNGVSGRMGYRQHLVRSILAIRDQGGIELPDGTKVTVKPILVGRSKAKLAELAAKHGISIVNAPGTVDAGYRGELLINLINLDRTTEVQLKRGDRIAQLLIQKVERAQFTEVDDLGESERGDRGFGSTGGFAAAPSATTHTATAVKEG